MKIFFSYNGFMNRLMIFLIMKYKKYKNPNKRTCRYSPTCSTYALESFQKFCFLKAFFLTTFRILRCNPFSKGGYDPVPKSKFEKELENLFPDVFKEIKYS